MKASSAEEEEEAQLLNKSVVAEKPDDTSCKLSSS